MERNDTAVLLVSGSLGVVLAVALAAGMLTAWHIVPMLGAGIAVAMYRELKPATDQAAALEAAPLRSANEGAQNVPVRLSRAA